MGFHLSYMFDRTAYPNLPLYLSGIEIQRATPQKVTKPTSLITNALDTLKIVLPTTIFFISFLEWWYETDYYKKLGAKPIPPPLPPFKVTVLLTIGNRCSQWTLCFVQRATTQRSRPSHWLLLLLLLHHSLHTHLP